MQLKVTGHSASRQRRSHLIQKLVLLVNHMQFLKHTLARDMSGYLVVIVLVLVYYITQRRSLGRRAHVIASHSHIRSVVGVILDLLLTLNGHLWSLFRASDRRRQLHYSHKWFLIVTIIVKPFVLEHFFSRWRHKLALLTQLSKVYLRPLSATVGTGRFP